MIVEPDEDGTVQGWTVTTMGIMISSTGRTVMDIYADIQEADRQYMEFFIATANSGRQRLEEIALVDQGVTTGMVVIVSPSAYFIGSEAAKKTV